MRGREGENVSGVFLEFRGVRVGRREVLVVVFSLREVMCACWALTRPCSFLTEKSEREWKPFNAGCFYLRTQLFHQRQPLAMMLLVPPEPSADFNALQETQA